MDKDDLLGSLLPEFLRFVLNGETPARLGGVLAGVLGTKIICCRWWWQWNMDGWSSELLLYCCLQLILYFAGCLLRMQCDDKNFSIPALSFFKYLFSRIVIKSAKSAVQSKLSQKNFPKFYCSVILLHCFFLETEWTDIFVHIEALLEEYCSQSSSDNIYCQSGAARGGE